MSSQYGARFHYDEVTRWMPGNVNSIVAMLVGRFPSEIGCASDFNLSCMQSRLRDMANEFGAVLRGGECIMIVASDRSLDELYETGGRPFRSTIGFTVLGEDPTTMVRYDPHPVVSGRRRPGPSPVRCRDGPCCWAEPWRDLASFAAAARTGPSRPRCSSWVGIQGEVVGSYPNGTIGSSARQPSCQDPAPDIAGPMGRPMRLSRLAHGLGV